MRRIWPLQRIKENLDTTAADPTSSFKIDEHTKKIEGGGDYKKVNPLGYVQVLMLDDGTLLTEGAAIVRYIADAASVKDKDSDCLCEFDFGLRFLSVSLSAPWRWRAGSRGLSGGRPSSWRSASGSCTRLLIILLCLTSRPRLLEKRLAFSRQLGSVRPKTFAGFLVFRAGTKLLNILATSDVELSAAALRKNSGAADTTKNAMMTTNLKLPPCIEVSSLLVHGRPHCIEPTQ